MDGEFLYYSFGAIALGLIAYKVLFGSQKVDAKTKQQKRAEIMQKYKSSLTNALSECGNDKEKRIEKKNLLLKQYSVELSQNIFFDKDEIKEIIRELSHI